MIKIIIGDLLVILIMYIMGVEICREAIISIKKKEYVDIYRVILELIVMIMIVFSLFGLLEIIRML